MVTVDLHSAIPLEDQIRSEIQRAVAQGDVKPGDSLPSVRQLAGDLGIHWNTVARAYRRLRDDGLLTVGRGRTVTVRDSLIRDSRDPERGATVDLLLDGAITQAKLLGLSYEELREIVERRLEKWRGAWEGSV
jgi:DNA-binding transcriptional regulator YhcF (GntR family)